MLSSLLRAGRFGKPLACLRMQLGPLENRGAADAISVDGYQTSDAGLDLISSAVEPRGTRDSPSASGSDRKRTRYPVGAAQSHPGP